MTKKYFFKKGSIQTMTHTAIWANLKSIMLKEKGQVHRSTWCSREDKTALIQKWEHGCFFESNIDSEGKSSLSYVGDSNIVQISCLQHQLQGWGNCLNSQNDSSYTIVAMSKSLGSFIHFKDLLKFMDMCMCLYQLIYTTREQMSTEVSIPREQELYIHRQLQANTWCWEANASPLLEH